MAKANPCVPCLKEGRERHHVNDRTYLCNLSFPPTISIQPSSLHVLKINALQYYWPNLHCDSVRMGCVTLFTGNHITGK